MKKYCRNSRQEQMEKWYSLGNQNTDIWKLPKVRILPCRFKVSMAEAMDITEMKIRFRNKWPCWQTVLCIVPDRLCMWKELLMHKNRIRRMCFRTKNILWYWQMRTIRKSDRKRYVPMNSVRLPQILHYLRSAWMGCSRWRPEMAGQVFAWKIINARHSISLLRNRQEVINWEIR